MPLCSLVLSSLWPERCICLEYMKRASVTVQGFAFHMQNCQVATHTTSPAVRPRFACAYSCTTILHILSHFILPCSHGKQLICSTSTKPLPPAASLSLSHACLPSHINPCHHTMQPLTPPHAHCTACAVRSVHHRGGAGRDGNWRAQPCSGRDQDE